MLASTLTYFLGLLVVASSLALCAPLEHPVPGADNALEERNPAFASVIKTLGGELVTQLITKIIEDKIKDQHAAQEAFTTGMVTRLFSEYPGKNVIIYHDQDSSVDFEGGEHGHVELEILDLGLLSFTKGYETYVFDSGTFTKAGDGGFINWSYMGNGVPDGDKVIFSPVQVVENPAPVPEKPALPPTSPIRRSNAMDGNYFVNCQHPDGTQSSGLAYYYNLTPGRNVDQQPDDYVDVIHGSYYDWEQTGSKVFPSTLTTVHWSVLGGSQDLQVYSNAGAADNGSERFWIYKDSGEHLYSIDEWTCNSIYFAF